MKNIERWVLFKYIGGQIETLSKPFKTKDQAEKARLKLPEKEQREVAVGVIKIEK
jgi:cell shape-determining protein MreC